MRKVFEKTNSPPFLVRLLSPNELSHILVETKLLRKKKKIVDERGKFRLYNFKATSNISFLINIYNFFIIRNKKVNTGPIPPLFIPPLAPQKIS